MPFNGVFFVVGGVSGVCCVVVWGGFMMGC